MRLQTITPAWIKALRRGGLVTLLAALALLGATQVAGAVKSPPPPPNPDNPYADDKYVEREIKKQLRERDERDAKRKTAEAKADRRESRTKFKDKSNHEALEIARAKFDKLIGAPAWTGLALREGERVKQYVGDFEALLQVGDGEDDVALVTAEIPLRNEQQQPIDLDLEPRGDGFAPAAGGVDLDIPGDLAAGIAIADGQLRIKPATDGATQASQAGDKVFYGNAQTDSDVMVVPSARGFETLTQLRSADSPEEIAFDVEVAGGATLHQEQPKGREQGEAPIEVLSPGGKRIATIAPPRALAADGEPVEVSYAIEGMRVTMNVEHREADVAYPIMVDPDVLYEDWKTWSWANGNRDNYGWQYGSWGHPWCGFGAYFGQGAWTFGQIVYHPDGYYCEVDNWVEAKWQAPRMSYIYRTEYIHMNHQNRFTCAVNGLWNVWGNNWDGGWAWVYCGDLWNHSRGHCPVSNDCNVDYGAPSNVAVFKVQIAYGNGNRNPGARAELGGSLMYLRDRDNPVIDDNGKRTDGRWYKAGSGSTSVYPRAHDDGLGMNKFQLNVPGQVDAYRSHPCTRSRCPGSWSLPNDGQSQFSYNIDALPEGINTITLNARDALDKITGTTWTVNVDRGAPSLNAYGPLRDAANTGRFWAPKTLSIQSSDGATSTNATQRSGVTAVDIYVDNVKKHSQTQNCFASCRLDFNWSFDPRAYTPGSHTVRAVARDGAGHETSSSTWTILTAHSDPGARTDKMDAGPDEAAPATTPMNPNLCVDPAAYCGEDDATVPTEAEAAAEPPLGDENPSDLEAATIRKGTDGWGLADDDYKNFDRKLIHQLYEGKPKKRARVIIPWDAALVGEGLPNVPAGGEIKPLYNWKSRDPSNSTLSAPESERIPVDYDRYLKPYDKWMEKAKYHGWDVIISFGASRAGLDNYKNQGPIALGPRVLAARTSQNATALSSTNDPYSFIYNVRRLLGRWKAMYDITPKYMSAYNEPNGPSYATSGVYSFPHLRTIAQETADPDQVSDQQIDEGMKYAVAYYNELRILCAKVRKNCSVLAGEMVDRRDMTRYLKSYKAKLNSDPTLWAYHPYRAGMYGTSPSTSPEYAKRRKFYDTYMKETGTSADGKQGPSVWFTEVGPLYSGSAGVNDWTRGEKQLEFQMKLAAHPRVKRFYYYATRAWWSPRHNPDGTLQNDPRSNTPYNNGHDSAFIDPWREEEQLPPDPATPNTPRYAYPKRADQIRPAYCTYLRTTRHPTTTFPRIDVFTPPPAWNAEGDRHTDGVRAC
jgi:hypothetical protein